MKTIDQNSLNEILSLLGLDIEQCSISALGNGHINDTFLVECEPKKLVLQRVNHHVFKQPELVINNAVKISQFLQSKFANNEYKMQPLNCVAGRSGDYILQSESGTWRALGYISECKSPESLTSSEEAKKAAYAFGAFSAALAEFDARSLDVIIDDFHNLTFRFQQLEAAVNLDAVNRAQHCIEEIRFALSYLDLSSSIQLLEKQLPIRVTHNDTKINNLLVHIETNEPTAVVDLDTCMPGYLMHDFGDLVRTSCSSIAEDADNIDDMVLKKDIYKGLVQGYLKAWDDQLDVKEIESLWLGSVVMPLMIGIRFLTDYLDGDNYFSTTYAEHNLIRAKNQFRLLKLIEQSKADLEPLFKESCVEYIDY